LATRIRMAAHMDGLPLSARWIKNEILTQEAALQKVEEK
jgi:hypothetical protein